MEQHHCSNKRQRTDMTAEYDFTDTPEPHINKLQRTTVIIQHQEQQDEDEDEGFQYLRYMYGDEVIPAFYSSREARQFMKSTELSKTVSNPEPDRFPHCKHIISILVTWEQVQKYLLNERQKLLDSKDFDTDFPAWSLTDEQISQKRRFNSNDNIFEAALSDKDSSIHTLASKIAAKASLDPVYKSKDDESVERTLRYLFFHMRSGIYVMIRRNRLQMFVPFANSHYMNVWGKQKSVFMNPDEVDRYFQKKFEIFPHLKIQNYLKDVSRWWANGQIINNVPLQEIWGDHSLVQFRDMLLRLCKKMRVPDIEFFINKRDFPHLKTNWTEAYDFLFDSEVPPNLPSEYLNKSFAPIFSQYCSLKEFADIPIPTVDDWEVCTGKVFVPKCRDLYSSKNRSYNEFSWEDKVNTAFFRGSATGVGVCVETNQRLQLAHLSRLWSNCDAKNECNQIDGIPFLNAGVTSWNFRDKKVKFKPMYYINPATLEIELSESVPIYEQAKFKYLIYVDGHCAAGRYSYLMSLGSVILKVESRSVAKDLWFFDMLKPWYDHIPITGDLSDLEEKIKWCKQNDGKCSQIAENARQLHSKYLNSNSILEYLQYCVHKLVIQ